MHQEHAEHGAHEHTPGCGHEQVRHDDHTDYVHDGHRHASHEGHWDEHGARVLGQHEYGSADAAGLSDDVSGAAGSTWAAGPEDRPEGQGDVGGS